MLNFVFDKCYLVTFIFLVLLCIPLNANTDSCSIESENSGWIIDAKSKDNYNAVTLSNGQLGLVASESLFGIKEIIINGVYDKEYEGGVSRIVRAPVFSEISLSIDGIVLTDENTESWKQELDMKRAALTTSVTYKNTNIEYSVRALRQLPHMMMGILKIKPVTDISISINNFTRFMDEHKECKSQFKLLRDAEVMMPVFVSEAMTCTRMHKISTCTAFMLDDEKMKEHDVICDGSNGMQISKKLKAGKTYRIAFIGTTTTSHHFYDPKNEAERMIVYALQQKIDKLIFDHDLEWNKLWEGDIIIEGNIDDQKDIRLALYNLYAFQREESRLSIPPMGLSTSTGYNGHVFWDSEIWMYPPILLLNHKLAKSHIDYRIDRLDKAIKRAENYGFDGAMFPWESDDSGEEATPTWCLTGPLEHHITADISIACWNYFRVTQDKKWLADCGYRLMKEVADFWVSRATANDDSTYSILNVVGANEYAPNVNDNAFTNGSAKCALTFATTAALTINEQPDKRWLDVAQGLRFNYMESGITKEHDQYNGEMIKQADVNLLAYPLGLINTPKQMRLDRDYYEDKIDKVNGPAMGNSILAIISCKLGEADKAYELFKRSYIPNKRPPFGVLSESPSSNNPYFATGAGGMLQAVLFGFAGLEFTDDGIKQNKPLLPKQWKSLTIKGVGLERKTYTIKKPH